MTLHPDCDDVIEVAGLRDTVTGAYLNAATVTWELQERAAGAWVPIADGTGSYSYVADSDGLYRSTVPAAVARTVGRPTRAKIVAAQGGVAVTAYVPVTVQPYQGEPAY